MTIREIPIKMEKQNLVGMHKSLKAECIVKDCINLKKKQKITLKYSNLAVVTIGQFMSDISDRSKYKLGSFSAVYDEEVAANTFTEMNDSLPDVTLKEFLKDSKIKEKYVFSITEKIPPSAADQNLPSEKETTETRPLDVDLPNKSSTDFVGLVNQSSTCYLNSILQTLFFTPEFRNAIYRWRYTGAEGQQEGSIPYQLQQLFLMLQTSQKRSIKTKRLTKSLGWENTPYVRDQQDVQEMLSVMFDSLEAQLINSDQKNLIKNLYQGSKRECFKCLQCQNVKHKDDIFINLSLSIKRFGSSESFSNLEESLRSYTDVNRLDQDNQYSCDICQEKCDGEMRTELTELPLLLTVHLIRFDYTENTRIKLNNRLVFPKLLDLNKFVGDRSNSSNNSPLKMARNFLLDSPESMDTSLSPVGSKGHKGSSSPSQCLINPDLSDSSSSMMIDEVESPRVDYFNNGMSDIHMDLESSSPIVQGPYMYELYAIMIHTGEAVGGHYTAYIKDFATNRWFSFDDESVKEIRASDIQRTYGSKESEQFPSPTNAYMLFYRQIDNDLKEDFLREDAFPDHIQKELKTLREEEAEEIRLIEEERKRMKIPTFCFHPIQKKLLEMELKINRNDTLEAATVVAWKSFDLMSTTPIHCVRLVLYNEASDWCIQSFDSSLDVNQVLKSIPSFDNLQLLLEIKKPEDEFQIYCEEDISLKVYYVEENSIKTSFRLREKKSKKLEELKEEIIKRLEISTPIEIVLENSESEENFTIPDDDMTLKENGFAKSNRVFVKNNTNCDDHQGMFKDSKFYEFLQSFINTIQLTINIETKKDSRKKQPSTEQVVPSLVEKKKKSVSFMIPTITVTDVEECSEDQPRCSEDQPVCSKDQHPSPQPPTLTPRRSQEQKIVFLDECPEAVAAGKSKPVPESWETETYQNETNDKYECTFSKKIPIDVETGNKCVECFVDRRMNTGRFKELLKDFVELDMNEFKIYLNLKSSENEIFNLNETIFENRIGDQSKIYITPGRPLKCWERVFKICELSINNQVISSDLFDVVISSNHSMLQLRIAIVATLKQFLNRSVPLKRCRIRKNLDGQPGAVYFDKDNIFEKMYAHRIQMYMEELPGDEAVLSPSTISIFVCRWLSDQGVVTPVFEVVIKSRDADELKKKISEKINIPKKHVSISKSLKTFPYVCSHAELKQHVWDPDCKKLDKSPMYVSEDGHLFYCRDKREIISENGKEDGTVGQKNIETEKHFPEKKEELTSKNNEKGVPNKSNKNIEIKGALTPPKKTKKPNLRGMDYQGIDEIDNYGFIDDDGFIYDYQLYNNNNNNNITNDNNSNTNCGVEANQNDERNDSINDNRRNDNTHGDESDQENQTVYQRCDRIEDCQDDRQCTEVENFESKNS